MFPSTSLRRVLFPRSPASAVVGGFLACLVLATSVSSFLIPAKALAANSSTTGINFQARLETASGAIVPDGTYNVQFKLYDGDTAGGPAGKGAGFAGNNLWTETWQNSNGQGITVKNGYLSVTLGSITQFGVTMPWDQNLWLTLNVGGTSTGASPTYDGEMNPRLKLTAVPYAARAGGLATYNGPADLDSTLRLLQPSVGNQNFWIDDQGAAGTYTICVQGATAANGGCAPTTGGAGYIQNQGSASQSSSNFWISGTGVASSFIAAGFDSAASSTLNLGTTNATTVNIATNAAAHTIAIGNGAAVQGITVGSTNSTSSLLLQGGTGGVQLLSQGGTLGIGNNAVAQTITIGNTTGATGVTLSAGTGSINLTSNTSSLTQSVTRLIQGGTGDVTLELNNSGLGKSVYLGMEYSSSGNFVLSTSASNTGTASSSLATPAYVQGATAAGSSSDYSLPVSFPSNATAGNAIIAAVTMTYSGDMAGIPFTCTDNQGDTFYTAVTRADIPNGQMTGVCYATNIVGGATTVTFSPKTYDVTSRGIDISEYSGIAKANPVDVVSANVGTATTTANAETSYSATTTQANDLIFGAITSPSNTATVTAGTGYTLRNNNVAEEGQTEDKVLGAAGSTAATFTYSATGPYTAVMVAFKAATTTSYGSTTNTDNLANPVLKVSQSGAATFKNVTDSTSAFQVQTSTASTLLDVDTSNARIGIGTNAPQYTLDVRGTSPSFQLASGSAIASTNLFNDNFNRANGTLGSSWTTVNGTFAIASNQASVTAYTNGAPDQESYVNSVTPQSPDYSVSATVSFNGQSITSETLLGVGGRITPVGTTDETGYFAYLDYTPGSGSYVELWERYNGSWGEFSDKHYVFSNSGIYNLKLSMVGNTIQAYVNNVLYINVSNNDITNAGTGAITACGAAYVMTWDNFSMDTIPSANGMVQKLVGDKLYLQGNNQADASFMTYDLTRNRLGIGNLSTSGPRATLDVNGQTILQSNGSSRRALQILGSSGTDLFAADTYDGYVMIDPDGNAYNSGLWQGLTFGGSNTEGIVSNRATTDLELWAGSNQALTINNNGSVLFKNGTNTTTGFQVQNAGGTARLTVDTTNGRVCIMVATCTHALGVGGQIGATNTTLSSTPDYSETMLASDNAAAADVVMADPNNNERVVKAVGPYNAAVTGIVSTGQAAMLIDHPEYYKTYNTDTPTNGIPIALAGRVPVHVTNEGGAIKPGDYLTTSSTPGYAMKATHAGPTIGKAYGFFDGTSGSVLALVNVSYYDPYDGNNLQSESGSFTTLQAGSATFTSLQADQAIVGSLNVSGAATLGSLTVTGDATFQGNLTVASTITTATIVIDGHITTGGSTPTVIAGAAAGQPKIVNGTADPSSAPMVTITGSDTAGMISVTTGDNATGSGALAHVTFAQNFATAYRVVITADNSAASNFEVYTTKSAAGFDLLTNATLVPDSTYQFDYIILGSQGTTVAL